MKVIGVGLNKTATKTLKSLLENNGFRHQTYDLQAFELYRQGRIDLLLDWMEEFDSFEDWPWPLFYRQIEARFPDAKFVLTTRKNPETWYRSLCKMAVRLGPLNDFEKHIYGYSMPQGRKQHHIDFYNRHNTEVRAHFANQPDKLIEVCFGDPSQERELAAFLGIELPEEQLPKTNESLPVYPGENLWIAHLDRIRFQTKWKLKGLYRSTKRFLRSQMQNRKHPH